MTDASIVSYAKLVTNVMYAIVMIQAARRLAQGVMLARIAIAVNLAIVVWVVIQTIAVGIAKDAIIVTVVKLVIVVKCVCLDVRLATPVNQETAKPICYEKIFMI